MANMLFQQAGREALPAVLLNSSAAAAPVLQNGCRQVLNCRIWHQRPAVHLALEHHDIQPSAALITLNGKLLLGQESARLAALVPELIATGRKSLVFDLRGVTHIDSTGIGRFIDAYSRITKIGGKMRARGGHRRRPRFFPCNEIGHSFLFLSDSGIRLSGIVLTLVGWLLADRHSNPVPPAASLGIIGSGELR